MPITTEDYTNKDEENPEECSDEDDSVVLYVDQKYCTICHVEQPLRAKHCKTCDQCVSMYDHHCVYVGNCVGERNKLRYYFYLIF